MDTNILREEKSVRALLREVERILGRLNREIRIMEVCGTHTMTAYRSGLGTALRKRGLKLISGPGCPVCITPDAVVSAAAMHVVKTPNVIIASFGDMLRVPTSNGSLLHAIPAGGSLVKAIYSPQEAVDIAAANPQKQIVFLAVGFETTIPSIAWVVDYAERKGIKNLRLLSCLRLVPPPLAAILEAGDTKLDGFIYPGHVSVIIGSKPYEFIPEKFGMPGAITGFEPADLVLGILSVLKQIDRGEARVDIAYKRAVRPEGNPAARRLMKDKLEIVDADWRGFGSIPKSGLKLRNKEMDAGEHLSLDSVTSWENKACRCGDIVKGRLEPEECPLFRSTCSPEKPMGPCMVSVEGTCLIHYKYGGVEWTE
ncbi:MAG: hydrogenase formation protein HypD [Candidatus Eisenbacteria bacterium]|nr:hydrogenase formation protein HypD [Candidatus Eisenbacteria bacterium]